MVSKFDIKIVEINNESYPTSYMQIEESYYDEDGYPQYEPVIYLHLGQIEKFSEMFNISFDCSKEICLAHEIGHVEAYLKGLNRLDEVLAWSLAPKTSLTPEKEQEIRSFCLNSYS